MRGNDVFHLEPRHEHPHGGVNCVKSFGSGCSSYYACDHGIDEDYNVVHLEDHSSGSGDGLVHNRRLLVELQGCGTVKYGARILHWAAHRHVLRALVGARNLDDAAASDCENET